MYSPDWSDDLFTLFSSLTSSDVCADVRDNCSSTSAMNSTWNGAVAAHVIESSSSKRICHVAMMALGCSYQPVNAASLSPFIFPSSSSSSSRFYRCTGLRVLFALRRRRRFSYCCIVPAAAAAFKTLPAAHWLSSTKVKCLHFIRRPTLALKSF